MRKLRFLAACCSLGLAFGAHADESNLFVPQLLGAQYTFIDQHQDALRSPYAGPLSLDPRGDTEQSHTFGAYFGVPLTARLQFYFD
ncbi:MAG: carbohydrate porin, partial [Rudaea sp.]